MDLLKLGAGYLEKNGFESARLEAELLLADLLKLKRVDLYLQFDRPLTEPEKTEFRSRLRRRADREPIQYIIGHTEFYGYRFKCKPGVLIPRPETEGIIELVREAAPEGGFENVLDIGTGTGILPITLLKEGLVKRAVAVDIASEAIELTRENAIALLNGTPENAELDLLKIIREDAFDPEFKAKGAPFDLIVSNPPYVRNDEWDTLPEDVKNHEPRIALTSGEDGADSFRALARMMPRLLTPGGMFICEMGETQGSTLLSLFADISHNAIIKKDLAGKNRYCFLLVNTDHEFL